MAETVRDVHSGRNPMSQADRSHAALCDNVTHSEKGWHHVANELDIFGGDGCGVAIVAGWIAGGAVRLSTVGQDRVYGVAMTR